MDTKEFSQIRHYLGKSQSQLARLLCISHKAVQSFEQGWRTIPASAERQLLFHLFLKRSSDENTKTCWEIKSCPDEWKDKCSAWEFKAGHLCWYINGTFCQGERQEDWRKKIKLCQQCEVFGSIIP
ncbi:helix-turn-helix domain-containing protein [Chloroflexota bacterium]